VCGSTVTVDKDQTPSGWIQIMVDGEKIQWWACQECPRGLHEILGTYIVTSTNPVSSEPVRDQLILTCDVCGRESTLDKSQRPPSGAPFGDWMKVTRNRRNIMDEDQAIFDVCSFACNRKLDPQNLFRKPPRHAFILNLPPGEVEKPGGSCAG